MKKLTRSLFFYLTFVLASILLSNCKDDTIVDVKHPVDAESKAEWLSKMNGDIQALKSVVVAIQNADSIKSIQIQGNTYEFTFKQSPAASFTLDLAVYDSPLIGAHKIDNNYYWTQIVGTGTSATTLLKNSDRSNYKIQAEGLTPQFDISEAGNWLLVMGDEKRDVIDQVGNKFRAIGTRSLFQSVTFDTDSNVTIITNEVPLRTYIVPKYRPFTFNLLSATTDTIQVASGFTIPLDFLSSGVVDFEFKTPQGWSATHTFAEDRKSGSILITAPTGIEAEYVIKGLIEISAVNAYGDKLRKEIAVKSEIGLVNYASVQFTDVAAGVNIAAVSFVFSDESLTSERTVTVIKAGDKFRAMLPEGFPTLKKALFTTDNKSSFTYYFPPRQTLKIGEQSLSLRPPQLLSYWQGGIVIVINESSPLTGVARYNITGAVMAPEFGPKVPWFPNGNIDVTTAMSTTDGAKNTAEIIKALGGPGTTAGFIARWAIRVRSGGYSDWYLALASEYTAFNTLWVANPTLLNQKLNDYGGITLIEGTHNIFWTSENMNATQARAYDTRNGGAIVPGTKVYGCYGMAFRKIN